MAVFETLTIFVLAALTAYVSADGSYNSDLEICCNGTIQTKLNNDGCCGNQAYSSDQFSCCYGNTLVPLTQGLDSTFCCTDYDSGISTLYNYDTEFCCDGKVFPTPADSRDAGKFYSCCGDDIYDYDEKVCCGTTLIPIGSSQSCCGDQLYDNTTQACCETFDEDKSEWMYSFVDVAGSLTKCCGSAGYNPSESTCCNDEVVPLPKGAESDENIYCCGSTAYDHNVEVCCTQYARDPETKSYEVQSRVLNTITEGRTQCCGTDLYDYNTELCCYDPETEVEKALPKPVAANEDSYFECCGIEATYDYDSQACLDNKVVDRPENFYTCGDQLYDSTSQACCVNTPYDTDGDMACCYGAEETYSTSTQVCAGDQVIEIDQTDVSLGKLDYCAAEYY